MTEDGERFNLVDCRRAGYCVKGTRKLCQEFGVDFKTFHEQGMLVSEARAMGHDALMDHVMRVKRESENGQETT